MAPSGPYGSDRLDITSTSSGTPLPLLPCNIEAKAGRTACQTGTSLAAKDPEAQAMGMGCEAGQAGGRCALKALRRRSGVRERPYGEGDTDHQQQELFFMVAARLAADQVFRAGIRRDRHCAG